MRGVRRAALCVVVIGLVGAGLAAPARAAEGVSAVLLPSTVAPGTSEQVVLDPALPLVTGVIDPLGDFSFGSVQTFLGGFQRVPTALAASPSSSEPHDLVLTLSSGGELTCVGCLSPGDVLAAPTGTVTPGDGSLALSLEAPPMPEAESLTTYRVLAASPGNRTWVDASEPVLTGLVNGTRYTVVAAARTGARAGELLWLTGRPGRPPAVPVVQLQPALQKVVATATADADGYPVTYHWTVKVGTAAPYTATTTYSTPLSVATSGRQVVTVTARATSSLGESPTSAPVTTSSWTFPSPPRSVRTSYANGSMAVSWLPPVDSGGTPVTAYNVELAIDGGSTLRRRVAATATAFSVPAGASGLVSVRAVTAAAPGDYAQRQTTADVGEVVVLDGTGHARRHLLTSGSWVSMGGPVLTGTPSLARKAGLRLVVAGDSSGRVWGWTARSGWNTMSSTRCRRPVASFAASGALHVGCVGSDGRLLTSVVSEPTSSVPTGLRFRTTTIRPLGRLAATAGVFVFRVAPFNSAGHNLVAVDLAGHGVRVPLACAGDPGAGTRENASWAACLASTKRLVWVRAAAADFRSTQRSTGTRSLSFSASGQAGVFVSSHLASRAMIAVAAADGTVRELDVVFGTWRVVTGLRVQPGVSVQHHLG